MKANQIKTSDNELRHRIVDVKEVLPLQYTLLFTHYFPEYNNEEGIEKVRRVVNLRAVDQDITEKLEKLIVIINEKK